VAKTIESTASNMSGEELTDFENRYIHKNGSIVTLMWTSHWSESEKLMFAVAHDVTETKARRAGFVEATERELAVIHNALDVICTIDGAGILPPLIRRVFRMWGYQPAELIGSSYLDLVVPEDVDKTIESTASNMSGEELTISRIVICKKRLNRYFDVDFALVGKRKLMFAVAHDVTERNALIKALSEATKANWQLSETRWT
jgi:PAS domain S-box-containing protein